jgi:hypothetical protein
VEHGEWIPLVINNVSDALLAEVPNRKYDHVMLTENMRTLQRNFQFFKNATIIDNVSLTLNDAIKTVQFDWLYVGIKAYNTLINGIDPEKLPPLIIFENDDIVNYLREKGYYVREEGMMSLAIKKI